MSSRAAYVTFLKQHGFDVLEQEVHGKNQTRFYHFVVKKNDQRLFCKVNIAVHLAESQRNSSLARQFTGPPAGVEVLTPVDELSWHDALFQFYPYVDSLPVSTESAAFHDFRVPEADIDTFLQRVLAVIAYIGEQDIVTVYEYNRMASPEQMVTQILRTIPAETPHAVELLQHILHDAELLGDYRLSIHDIQPQNMFWDTNGKVLSVFDLENLQPNLAFHDHASFFTQLWVVYDQPEYARRFMALFFRSLLAAERHAAYEYIRCSLSRLSLKYYANFKQPEERRRIEKLIRWLRSELLLVANDQ